MEEVSRSKRRPFHETIVEAIKRALSGLELINLGELIVATKIPQNHNKIIDAWVDACIHHARIYEADFYYTVIDELLEQKEEAGKKAEVEQQATAAS